MTAAHERVVVEADGGSRGNPGPAGYGAVVFDADGGLLAERSESIGEQTNNVAEYSGLIAGLEAAHELGARYVAVRMDSKLVVEQMKGTWQIKNSALRELARRAVELRASFESITFEWIPRERNKHADRLANEAMDRAAGRPVRAERPRASTGAAPVPQWSPPVGAPTRFVLVRHGATAHSADKRFSGRNDLPLDETGERQAAALAVRDFGAVRAVVSSPLRRTQQTASLIADRLGLAVETVDDLAELDFGAWEGLTATEARARDGAAFDAWAASQDNAPPDGESFAALGRRVRRGREAIVAAHTDETVVVVTHVTPIKTLICFALDAPPQAMFRLHLDTASVSVIDYFADGASSVRLVNDTSHLRG
ncbi:bifunctional RNase H/acid phosphatase [uncultured Jatrophihabitans sp.]|uniref:bifunctional RNase H/acid phosphatase n=1 Tax=uncultured Jatrophihabitans sp. TaxID=1610747 RepID=UPI0035CA915C